jgi:hypothetical protein
MKNALGILGWCIFAASLMAGCIKSPVDDQEVNKNVGYF